MLPRKRIATARTPDTRGVLELFQRGDEFSISINGRQLMGSRQHGSETQLAGLACGPAAARPRARVLVGGLGLGFTLAAALAKLRDDATVVVAELVPAVVQWNRDLVGHLAGRPLEDRRVVVQERDVCEVLKKERSGYDAVLLDVDNGPDSMTRADNAWLYGPAGLPVIYAALRPRGVLAVWSAGPDRGFTGRLRAAGFAAREKTVSARECGRGARHRLWIAARPD